MASFQRIPITTPARTLLDLASFVAAHPLERALGQAFARGLATRAEIRNLLRRHPRARGAPRLRGILDAGTPAFTRSEAEDRFLHLIRKGQLRDPEVNVRVAGHEVDFLWRAERLVAEVDGFAFHASAAVFESDRRRDAVLAAAGLRVVRLTWRQLVGEPEAVLVRLAQALASPRPGGPWR